jgi:hypothetical protein
VTIDWPMLFKGNITTIYVGRRPPPAAGKYSRVTVTSGVAVQVSLLTTHNKWLQLAANQCQKKELLQELSLVWCRHEESNPIGPHREK